MHKVKPLENKNNQKNGKMNNLVASEKVRNREMNNLKQVWKGD